MISIINKSYDLLKINKFKFIFTFGSSFFVFIFLWIFEPFGIYTLTQLQKLYSLTLFISSGLVVWLIHIFILQNLFLKKLTIGNTLLWLTWIVFVLGVNNFIVGSLLYPDNKDKFTFILFIWSQMMTFIIVLIPISIIILLHYNFLLKRSLEKAKEINKAIQKRSKSNHKKQLISIKSNNLKEHFEIYLDSLIYITSADNYIDVYFLKNNTLENKLIRNTLSNIENYFSDIMEIIKCHKSFIVNISYVKSISGNSAGYKLNINEIDFTIPVSRKYNKKVLNALRHIN